MTIILLTKNINTEQLKYASHFKTTKNQLMSIINNEYKN